MYKKLHTYLMALPEVTLDHPFRPDVPVYRIEDKIFAIYFKDTKEEYINLKCEPELAEQLRAVFSEITPGYHMNKKHWNTLDLKGKLPIREVFRQIDHSYDLVVKKLPKATKQRLRIRYEKFADLS